MQVGDRVVVVTADSPYQGRQGIVLQIIATESSGVDSTAVVVVVRLDCLVRLELPTESVSTIVATTTNNSRRIRAPVFDGVLDPRPEGGKVGPALLHFLAAVRRIAAETAGSNSSNASSSFEDNIRWTMYALQHWKETIYPALVEESTTWLAAHQRILRPALHSRDALQSCDHGFVIANGWLVGRDATGSYVVPVTTAGTPPAPIVYKLVGIRHRSRAPPPRSKNPPTTAAPLPQLLRHPLLLRGLCIFPFYGRLLYDSSLPPPPSAATTTQGKPVLERYLHSLVMRAFAGDKGAVLVEHLAELDID